MVTNIIQIGNSKGIILPSEILKQLRLSLKSTVSVSLDAHPVNHWCYGHFHQSWNSAIDGIFYRMLDIMEFCTI